MDKIIENIEPHAFDVVGKRNWRLIGGEWVRVADQRGDRAIPILPEYQAQSKTKITKKNKT